MKTKIENDFDDEDDEVLRQIIKKNQREVEQKKEFMYYHVMFLYVPIYDFIVCMFL